MSEIHRALEIARLAANAAFSTRIHAPTAAPREAFCAVATRSSNMHSNLRTKADANHQVNWYLWMKLRLWITQPAVRSRRTSGIVRSPALPS